jgi:hypothetical protein
VLSREREVVVESPLSPSVARRRLRQALAGDSLIDSVLRSTEGRCVVGWVQDPTFKLRAVGQSRRNVRRRSRVLRGTLVPAAGGGCHLDARFDPSTWLLLPQTRLEDEALRQWLRLVLEADPGS